MRTIVICTDTLWLKCLEIKSRRLPEVPHGSHPPRTRQAAHYGRQSCPDWRWIVHCLLQKSPRFLLLSWMQEYGRRCGEACLIETTRRNPTESLIF